MSGVFWKQNQVVYKPMFRIWTCPIVTHAPTPVRSSRRAAPTPVRSSSGLKAKQGILLIFNKIEKKLVIGLF